MNEVERVREQIADLIKAHAPEFAEDKTDVDVLIHQILSLEGIAVLDDDQTVPYDISLEHVKLLKEAGFKKVKG